MANQSGDWDPDRWIEYSILALLLLYVATNLLEVLIAFLRERGLRGHPLVGNNDGDGNWRVVGDALAMPSTSGDLRIFPNIDPEGQYNVWLVDQPPAIQEPVQNIDAAEADLNLWLTVAEVASLPRQIEMDHEANMMATRRQVPSSVAASHMVPSSLVDDVAVGAPQHLPPQSPVSEVVAADVPAPEVVEVHTDVLPQRIENEDKAHAAAEVEEEVAMEDVPPRMLERTSENARHPQVAAVTMTVPAGGLESNLEERMPVDHPEAGGSSADFLDKNTQDDVDLAF